MGAARGQRFGEKGGGGHDPTYSIVTWPLSIGNRAFRKGGKSRGVPDQERRGQRTGALCGEDQLTIYTVLIITKPLTEENNLLSILSYTHCLKGSVTHDYFRPSVSSH